LAPIGGILRNLIDAAADQSRPKVVITYNTSHYILLFRLNLVRALQESGYDVVAVSPLDRYSCQLAAYGIIHVPMSIDSRGISPIRDLSLLLRLFNAYRAIRPIAILHFTIKPNIFGSIAARPLRVPTINNITGLGSSFLRGGIVSFITQFLYRFAFAASDTVFFQNHYDLDIFQTKRLVTSSQASLLPGSGIDTQKFSPRHSVTRRHKFVFLLIGRLIKDKGVNEYVEAVRKLKILGHHDFEAHLLGQLMPADIGGFDLAQINEWECEQLVRYLGEVDDVRDVIAAADCVVLPSYREGTSKSLLEAASMQKPIVATDVPGCNNVVQHNHNGLLCIPKNIDDLAEKMLMMLRMPADARIRMGALGRAKVENEFDEKIVIRRYIDKLEALS
jgi:glycosyltransferase involved in cell wall biosynthesis